MTEINTVTPDFECVELRTTQKDWDDASPQLLETLYAQMQIIRSFEEHVLQLSGEGLIHGPAHSSIGQEGAAVGSMLALGSGDAVNGTHRGHHQFLAAGLTYLKPQGFSLLGKVDEAGVQTFLHRTLSEILGLKAGFSGGRGGSMHLQWLEAGALGTNAIVGGGVPSAAGNALAQKHDAAGSGDSRVTVTYFGDGAANIGSTLETLNLAAAWRLPLTFFIENNLYAVSTHIADVTGESRLALRAPGFGLKSWRVDGMDPLAVYLAQSEATAHMRAGSGATVVEADTYRYFHQNGPFRGSSFGYRTKDEEQEWRNRDPLQRVAADLTRRGIVTEEQLATFVAHVNDTVARIIDEIVELDPEGTNGKRRIREDLWPDPATVEDDLRAPVPNLSAKFEVSASGTTEVKLVEAIADTLLRRMNTDERIVVLGEDIHRLGGGTNGATRGLVAAHPDRVLATPISENAFVGLSGGLAATGRYKPVVELMYADFAWVAADQLFNQIGKARHMFGGQSKMPVVLRTKAAMGGGYGSQHSMDPAGIFATNPGWRIVAPTTPYDYVGLMNTALELDDPILVLEHIDLYGNTGMIPEGDLDYCLPVGEANIRREGSGLTVLSYLNMVDVAVEAAGLRPEVDAEVIDLRWLDRASFDWGTVGESIRKTNNVLIIEQGSLGTSYGTWVADEIQRRFFDFLDQPVQRVTGGQASPSISKVLESAANADVNDVVAGMDEVLRNLGRTLKEG